MSSFGPSKRHLRELLISFFNLKKSAAEAYRLLVEAYGDAVLSERSCREWFQKFKNGEFDIEDKERSGRPKVYEDAKLEALLYQDSCQTQEELALTLGVTQQAISHRLKSSVKKYHLHKWSTDFSASKPPDASPSPECPVIVKPEPIMDQEEPSKRDIKNVYVKPELEDNPDSTMGKSDEYKYEIPIEDISRQSPDAENRTNYSNNVRHTRLERGTESKHENCEVKIKEEPVEEFNYEVPVEEEAVSESQEVDSTGNTLHSTSDSCKAIEDETNGKSHTDDVLHSCDVCGQKFTTSQSLVIHIRTHTGDKPYACDLCERKFSRSGDLRNHKETHAQHNQHQCDTCNRVFSNRSNLKIHLLTHTGVKPYECATCQKRFSSSGSFNRHTKTHTGDTPHNCDVCNKNFSSSFGLRSHIKTHTGEKPYRCEMCETVFAHKSHYERHRKTHMTVKPFKCDICEREFYKNWNLMQHKRTHTGDRPYSCDVCERRFSTSSILMTHKRIHIVHKSKT